MTSIERTARIDDCVALIADDLGLPTDELVSDWVLCLRTVPIDGPPRTRVVTSRGDIETSCWLLCSIQRLLVRTRSRLRSTG